MAYQLGVVLALPRQLLAGPRPRVQPPSRWWKVMDVQFIIIQKPHPACCIFTCLSPMKMSSPMICLPPCSCCLDSDHGAAHVRRHCTGCGDTGTPHSADTRQDAGVTSWPLWPLWPPWPRWPLPGVTLGAGVTNVTGMYSVAAPGRALVHCLVKGCCCRCDLAPDTHQVHCHCHAFYTTTLFV